jgi:hypothetical protein
VLSGVVDPDTETSAYHVVLMADIPDTNPAVLDGLTIKDGIGADNADRIDFRTYTGANGIDQQSGGGMHMVNASPVLNNLRIENNIVPYGNGGGIFNLARDSGTSSPRLTKVVIYNNRAAGAQGGGMFNRAVAAGAICRPVLSGVTIDMNQAGEGGGGLCNSVQTPGTCAPEIKDSSVISRNTAPYGGGVFETYATQSRYEDVVIQGNSAGTWGGGVYINNMESRPVFTNVTITGNRAAVMGGGVWSVSSYLRMTHVTISRNTATQQTGGGIYNVGGAILTNIRVEENYSREGAGIYNGLLDTRSGRAVMVITNGVIRGNETKNTNTLYPGNGGGIYNYYEYAAGSDNRLHVALTNVLIADNTAIRNGGGIYNANTIPLGTATPGNGISISLNNVTITNNTANVGNGSSNGGGGIYIPEAASGNINKVTVTASNSIIWGNDAPNQSSDGRDNIFNPTASRLTLNYSLAQNGYTYTTGDSNKNPGSFSNTLFTDFSAGDYTLRTGTTGLINGGSNTLYPNNMSTGAGTLLDGALTGTAGTRETDFKALIQAAVYTANGPITKDATAAVGNAPATGNNRIQGTAIDVGAYENQ